MSRIRLMVPIFLFTYQTLYMSLEKVPQEQLIRALADPYVDEQTKVKIMQEVMRRGQSPSTTAASTGRQTRRMALAPTANGNNSFNTQNQKSMSSSASLQERANAFMIKEAKAELKEAVSSYPDLKIEEGQRMDVMHSPETRKVVLPLGLNKLQAAFNLIKQFQEEETLRTYNRAYENFFINDFLTAMQIMVPQFFGMLHVSHYDTNGRPASQDYIQFPSGFDDAGRMKTEKGYVGSIKAPVWEDAIIDILPPGRLAIRAKMKFEADVNNFLEEVERAIKKHSIVRGTSVSIEVVKGGLMAKPILPRENKKIVLSEDVRRMINNLIIPSMKDRSKTSLLFTGDFGTGKTETALKVGLEGQRRFGRTFFYLDNADLFPPLIPYIKNYQGAIVFIEDIDQIAAGDRDTKMNDLLNQLDGNELKNVDCTFIFTTNNHDNIHPAMRRPGRIDQIVHFDYCNVDMISEIFRLHAEGMDGAKEVDYVKAATDCPEQLQGAVVAEIARRAVRYSNNLHDGKISTDRFLDAIASMRYHIEFMRKDQKKDHSMESVMGQMFYGAMRKAFPELEVGNVTNFNNSPFKGLNN
jgi:hypothetical protein